MPSMSQIGDFMVVSPGGGVVSCSEAPVRLGCQVRAARSTTQNISPAALPLALWRCGSAGVSAPSPLLLAIAAVCHAAPVPPPALAPIDEIDRAIRRATFPHQRGVGAGQQILDRQRAGMQGYGRRMP